MRILLPATTAIALAACSAQPTPDAAPPESNAASASVPTAPAPPSPAPLPNQVAVVPGEFKTFGDWAVGCDNTALCTMASLGPESGPFPEVTMAVLRQPGPDGAIDLSFDIPGNDAPITPVAVAIDGQRIALPALNGPAAARVAAAMANGRTLTVLEAGARPRARLSLAGVSAALRWIDAQQGRAGSVTALVAKGAKPASSVPDRRAAPVIRAVVPTGIAAKPTTQQLAAMRRKAGCDDPGAAQSDGPTPESYALGDGATLVAIPCSVGAYNLSSSLFVLRGDTIAPARTDAPSGMNPDASPGGPASVVNARWNHGELTSYAKGRGLGDCGVQQSFVWDGARLRLAEQSEMGECRGNPNYIPTWRAQVVRG